MKKLNQKGFGLVEGLLIVIALALVVFVGYYVWHSQKQADKTLTAADKATQNSSTATSQKSASNAMVFEIKEWGVKATYTSGPDLQYSFAPDVGPDVAYLSTQDLANAAADCAQGGAGLITRVLATDHYSSADNVNDSTPTAQEFAATLTKNEYAHIGNYFYFYRHPQGICGNGNPSDPSDSSHEDQVGDLMNAAISQANALLPKLQAE